MLTPRCSILSCLDNARVGGGGDGGLNGIIQKLRNGVAYKIGFRSPLTVGAGHTSGSSMANLPQQIPVTAGCTGENRQGLRTPLWQKLVVFGGRRGELMMRLRAQVPDTAGCGGQG